MEHVGRTAIELARRVSTGECSARSVVEEHLGHLAEVEHRLGAFVTVGAEAVLDLSELIEVLLHHRTRRVLPGRHPAGELDRRPPHVLHRPPPRHLGAAAAATEPQP